MFKGLFSSFKEEMVSPEQGLWQVSVAPLTSDSENDSQP